MNWKGSKTCFADGQIRFAKDWNFLENRIKAQIANAVWGKSVMYKVNLYLDKNKALPSDYAIKGFDITFDILMRMASGKTLYHTFGFILLTPLQTWWYYLQSCYIIYHI